jgi:hypothetical protein
VTDDSGNVTGDCAIVTDRSGVVTVGAAVYTPVRKACLFDSLALRM